MATLTFSGFSNTMRLVWILSDFGVTFEFNMAAVNREDQVITFILASIHDGNETPKAITVFRGQTTRPDYCGHCPMCG
jgi:hypothetical protein